MHQELREAVQRLVVDIAVCTLLERVFSTQRLGFVGTSERDVNRAEVCLDEGLEDWVGCWRGRCHLLRLLLLRRAMGVVVVFAWSVCM